MLEPKNGLYITSADFEQWQDYTSPLIESHEKCMGDCSKCKKSKTYEETNDPDLKVKNITFVVTERCNLDCTYCFSGDTLVTMKDYSTKPIKDIKIGDQILAFNELSEKKESQNKLKVAKVEKLYKRESETIKMYFDDGTSITVTPNHPILARRNTNNPKFDYKPAGNFKEGQKVYSIPHICPDYNILDDNNYMIGYFIGIMMGDGSYKKYKDNKGYDMYKIRLAVKDDEIIQRMTKIMNILDIRYYLKDFKVSEKYEMIKPAIFANTKETYDKINEIIDGNFGENNNLNYLKGFLAGIYDAEGHISKKKSNTIRITNGDEKILKEIKRGLKSLSIEYKVEKTKTNVNVQCYNIRLCKRNSSLKFILNVLPAIKRKGLKRFIGNSIFYRKTITKIEKGNTIDVYNIGTSERTYIANDILVHNCYECHKTGARMSKEVAKQAVDFIFDKEKVNGYYDIETSPAVILEFIGGEPLLEIELMDYIVEYFKFKAFELNHPWATNYMISLTTNGILYNDEKVQNFLKRNPGKVSVGITIDGNKELHDSCRIFPDGSGSYDIVEKSIKTWLKTDGQPQTKITLCPQNVAYLNDALKNVWGLGINGAFTNCVFEEGWTLNDAKILYSQMIELADYLLEDNRFAKYYCSLFDDSIGEKNKEDRNWCFKAGTKVLTPNGNVNIEDLNIGDLVVSGDKSIQTVENIIKRYSEDTAIISASGMFKTYTTLEHPYLVKKFKHVGNKGVYRYSEPQWVNVKDIKKGDKIALHCHKFGDIDIDKDIAYIVGRYIGDGWCSTTGYKLCCSYKEFDELKEAMNKANINYSVDNYRTVKQFNIFKNNTELIKILEQIGHTAPEKNIPKEAFNWNKKSVKRLLKGLFDADGCYNKKNKMIKFNTVSETLANDVLVLLRGLKYFPTCYKNNRAGKSFIEGREVNIKDRYEVYFYLNNKRARFMKYDKKNQVCWTTVRAVKLNCKPYDVYNLTVSNTHTFIANGVVVHNCGGNGSMLAIAPDGRCFPCIRFMKYALSVPGRKEQPIGDIWKGLDSKEDNEWLKELKKITMSSQCQHEDNKKCLDCPIASGCALCTGYNYDKFGDPNHKATFICDTHKARVMANCYYWNKLYKQLNIDKKFNMNIPKEWALEIISEDEYNKLLDLSK